jgi:hypothetical protein
VWRFGAFLSGQKIRSAVSACRFAASTSASDTVKSATKLSHLVHQIERKQHPDKTGYDQHQPVTRRHYHTKQKLPENRFSSIQLYKLPSVSPSTFHYRGNISESNSNCLECITSTRAHRYTLPWHGPTSAKPCRQQPRYQLPLSSVCISLPSPCSFSSRLAILLADLHAKNRRL